MKKLLQLLVVCFFVFSCTQDTFEDKTTDDTSAKLVADQFDNSYLGVYKGLFTTNDGLTRGSVVVTLLPSNDGVAQITLSTGEMIELKSSRVKLTVDNTVNNLRFSSAGISNIDATLDFSVEGDGLNPSIVNVNFDNKESDIVIAKNLSRAPLTTITGSYACDNCASFPSTSRRTWNVMSIGAGDAQVFTTQVNFSGRTYVNGGNVQSGCVTTSGYTTCNIGGYVSPILGYNVQWSGTHKYNAGSGANETQCADVSGTWAVISGTGPFSGAVGTFVSDSPCTGPAVANDACLGAIPVSAGTYTGSNLNATNAGAPTGCTNSLIAGRGVWYSYTSTSNAIVTVDTNGTSFAPNASPDTLLGVFSGSCGALTCIESDDDDGDGLLSTITFSATANATYYIYLVGYDNTNDFGDYTLNVAEYTTPVNDLCGDATPVVLGTPVNAATVGASTTGAPATSCNSVTLNTAGGVWHTYTNGTAASQLIKASTAGSSFDTKLGVFSGTCLALTCVTANDDGPTGVTPQSQLTFTAAANTTYLIYVTGYLTNTGNYTLNLTEIVVPPNDLCGGATAVTLGTPVNGNSDGASTTGAPSTACNSVTLNVGPGTWHTFTTPTTKVIKASTVGSSFDTRLGVVTGTCGGTLTCITANDNGPTGVTPQSELSFTATGGTLYRIYVTGGVGASGPYTLTLTEVFPPANDLCTTATPIACGGSTTGTNVNSTNTLSPTTCTTGLLTPGTLGVWYSFSTPVDKQVTVSTEDVSLLHTLTDTQLRVFSGTCGALTCIGADDDSGTTPTLTSIYTFNATANTPYLFFIAGYNNAVGTFALSVTCVDPPPPVTFSLTPGCGTSFVDHAGNANYASNRNDTYTMDAGAGNKVTLPFTTFLLETGWDFMRLYNSSDGVTLNNEITSVGGRTIANISGTRIGFTGTTNGTNSLQGQTVVSSGRYLIATFKSDGSGVAAGFLAYVGCAPRLAVDSRHQRTSDTFMPAMSPSSSFPKESVVTEAQKMQHYNKQLQEAERRANNATSKPQEAEARKSEVKPTKIFRNNEEREIYYSKRKQK